MLSRMALNLMKVKRMQELSGSCFVKTMMTDGSEFDASKKALAILGLNEYIL